MLARTAVALTTKRTLRARDVVRYGTADRIGYPTQKRRDGGGTEESQKNQIEKSFPLRLHRGLASDRPALTLFDKLETLSISYAN